MTKNTKALLLYFRLSITFSLLITVDCSCQTSRDELKRLKYDCTDQQLPFFPSDVPNNTQVLILKNSMQNPVIPSFKSMNLANLQVLDLSSNRISYLAGDTFKGMKSLLSLDIRGNDVLTTSPIPRGLFADLTGITTLKIKGDNFNTTVINRLIEEIKPLKELKSFVYQYGDAKAAVSIAGELSQLTSLEFHAISFSDEAFQDEFLLHLPNLTQLEALSIRHCKLNTLGNKAVAWMSNLRHLNLACNDQLCTIDTLRYLGNQTSLSNLKTLILDHTHFHYSGNLNTESNVGNHLSEKLFCNLSFSSSLERLSLQRLGYFSLDSTAFNCLTKLRSLNFGHNLPYALYCGKEKASVVNCYESILPSLQAIQFAKFSNLMITSPTKDTHCDEDNISFNDYFVDETLFSNVTDCIGRPTSKSKRQNIMLLSRQIALPPCLRGVQFNHFYRTESRQPPFKIDFSPGNILELVNFSDTILNPDGLILDTIQINGLNKLRVIALQHTLLSRVHMITIGANSLEQLDLSKNRFDQMTKAQFSNMFTRPMKKLQVLNLSSSNIYELPSNFFWQFPRLSSLDVSFNKISQLTLDLSLLNSTNIFSINVTSNQLSSLNDNFTITLDFLASYRPVTIVLSNNQFQCNCNTLSFMHWFQTTSVNIDNKTNIQCTYDNNGKSILLSISSISISEMRDNCFAKLKIMYISLSMVLTVIVISFFVGLSLYKQRYRLRWYWYNNKKKICGSITENLTEENSHWQYSAYVNYWRVGGRWVMEEIVKRIEDLGRENVVVRGRDSNGGENIADFIMEAIINSKKLIYVIGDDVKLGEERDWFEFSFYMALEQRKNNLSDFVFVIKNDINYDEVSGTLLRVLCQPDSSVVMRIECYNNNQYWINDLKSIFNNGSSYNASYPNNEINDTAELNQSVMAQNFAAETDTHLIDITANNCYHKDDRESDEELLTD